MVNWLALLVAALVPYITGSLWYNPKTFGGAWMRACGQSEEKLRSGNFALRLLICLPLNFFIAFTLQFIVIHQTGVFAALMHFPNEPFLENFKPGGKYALEFRTFKHGALHGFMSGLFFAMPIIGVNAAFERRSFKYVAIHAGYWMLTLLLMGGIICAWV